MLNKAASLGLFVAFALQAGAVFAQAPNISYSTPQIYTNATITPLTPANTGGAVPPTIYGNVTTFAGSGAAGSTNGTGTAASFHTPTGIATDAAGNLYIADTQNNEIRKITVGGVVSLYAGGTTAGATNGPAAAATFNGPTSLAIDASGNLFVADANNNLIREISTAGVVSNFAGSGAAGKNNGTGVAASFNLPSGIVFDAAGNLFVADAGNNLIRKITPGGLVSTYAGNGQPGLINTTGLGASFTDPQGIAIDAAGNLYIGDTQNNVIRQIDPAVFVHTFAGSGIAGTADGSANIATFTRPVGVTMDILGNVYVADAFNDEIREVSSAGVVTTLAGVTSPGATDGVGAAARFYSPAGVAIDAAGNLCVADAANNLIRKITLTGYTISAPLPDGLVFDPKTGVISGTPIASSPPTNYTITAYNKSGGSSTVVNIEVLPGTQTQTITFPALPAVVEGDPDFDPGATSTNTTIPITYTSSNPAVATIVNGMIHIVSSGSSIITATQGPNATYAAANPVTQQLTVGAAYLIFNALPHKSVCDTAGFDPGATSNAPITYSAGATTVVKIINNLVYIQHAGSVLITANNGTTSLAQELVVDSSFVAPRVTVTPDEYTLCDGPHPTFTAHAKNGGSNPTYLWLLNGLGTLPVSTDSTITITFTTLKPFDEVTCIVYNNDYCKPIKSIPSSPVFISNTPLSSATVSVQLPLAVCAGDPMTFTAVTANIDPTSAYQWKVNGSEQGTDNSNFTAVLKNNDIVTCTVTSPTGCMTTITSPPDTVKINPLPTINFASTSVKEGVQVQLTPAITGNIATYKWEPADGLDNPNIANPIASPLKTTLYQLTVTTVEGCTASNTINVISEVIPPNTFTPNGDGINDFWDIPRLVYFPNCTVNIYTRYGSPVYHSIGYPKPWDGNYGGKALPVGVYYYVIEFKDGTETVSGWVTIVR